MRQVFNKCLIRFVILFVPKSVPNNDIEFGIFFLLFFKNGVTTATATLVYLPQCQEKEPDKAGY